MLRQKVCRVVLAWNEVQPHKSLVSSFFGEKLSSFVRSALLRVNAVLDLGDRRRTVIDYPHAAVALMPELTPKAGETSTPGTTALTSASVELRLTAVCRLVF